MPVQAQLPPTEFLQQRRFRGVNVYLPPQDLAADEVQQADNLLVQGGLLVSRPGFQGVFAEALGTPIYASFAYVKADHTSCLFFVSGGPTSGKLYQWNKGDAAPTGVTGSPTNLTTAKAMLARVGGYGYGVDATNDMFRFDPTGGVAPVFGEDPPTAAPSVSLANTVIDSLTSATGWTADTATGSGTTLLPSGQSDINAQATGNVTDGTQLGTSWIAIGPTPSIAAADGSRGIPSSYATVASKWFQLDDPNGGFSTLTGVNTLQNLALDAPNADRYCTQFALSYSYYTSDTRSLQGLKFILTAYSDTAGSDAIAQSVYTFTPNFAGQQPGQSQQHVFTFPNLSTEIKSIILNIVGGDGNVNASAFPNWQGFLFVANVSLAPIGDGITLTASSNGLTVTHAEPSSAYWGIFGGARLTHDYGSGSIQDWSKKSHIAINLTTPSGASLTVQQIQAAGLTLRIGFRADGSTAHYTTNLMTISTDGSYASVDISTVDSTILAAFRYLEIIFESDLTVTQTTATLFTMAGITEAGNLSMGYADYSWPYTEVNASLDPTNLVNVIESDPSPTSATLTPTVLQAEAKIVLNAPVNGDATHFYIYRYGGAASEQDTYPTARLIAKVPIGADATDPNGYWTWDHTTRTLIDNTPDINLLIDGVTVMISGRGKPPTGAQAIATWQNRMWLAKGSTLYGSWLLTESNSAGLYFNSIAIPDDPNLAIKGTQVSVGGADNDDIVALIPLGVMLIVVKSRSVWMVTGTDGTNFQLSGHLLQAGVGCVAPRGNTLVQGRVWMLSGDGLWEYDGGDYIAPRSLEIEPYLCPAQVNGAAIPADIYAGSALLYAGRRVYLTAPGDAEQTENNTTYVFDMRQQGWTRWTGTAWTGGCTTSTTLDTAEIYMSGYDGQIYQIVGEGDKATPTATAQPVPFAYRSRGMGQETEGINWWRAQLPDWVYASVISGEQTTLTAGLNAAGCPTAFSHSYQVNGRISFRLAVRQDVKGDFVDVSLSGATVTRTTIVSMAATCAQGNPFN